MTSKKWINTMVLASAMAVGFSIAAIKPAQAETRTSCDSQGYKWGWVMTSHHPSPYCGGQEQYVFSSYFLNESAVQHVCGWGAAPAGFSAGSTYTSPACGDGGGLAHDIITTHEPVLNPPCCVLPGGSLWFTPGATIEIYGYNWSGSGNSVTLNGVPATILYEGVNQINVTLPNTVYAGTWPLTVTNSYGLSVTQNIILH